MKSSLITLLLVVAATIFYSCGDEGGLKGSLAISITDSPADDPAVSGVNLVFLNVEVKRGDSWKSLKSFDQPLGVNLLEYSGGKSLKLIDQYVDPGNVSAVRFTLNIANPNESVIRSPQSNVSFSNGTTQPLYLADGLTNQLVIEKEIGISSAEKTDFTFDIDVRKSVTRSGNGSYVINPVVRVLETNSTGTVRGQVVNTIPQIDAVAGTQNIVVFAYTKGKYTSGEMQGNVGFNNSTTASKINSKKFGLGFLEEGTYDLIFVSIKENGEYKEVIGCFKDVAVKEGEEADLDIDLTQLSPA